MTLPVTHYFLYADFSFFLLFIVSTHFLHPSVCVCRMSEGSENCENEGSSCRPNTHIYCTCNIIGTCELTSILYEFIYLGFRRNDHSEIKTWCYNYLCKRNNAQVGLGI